MQCYRGAPSVEQDRGHQGPPQAQPAADAAAAGAPIEELRAQEETPRAKRRERRGEAAGGEERKKKKQERSRWTKLQVETLVKAMEDLFYDWRLKVEVRSLPCRREGSP